MLIYKFNDPDGLFVSITDAESGQGKVAPTSRVDLEGVTVLPYKTEIELSRDALEEAELLYKSIKDSLRVVVESISYDIRDRFDFDYQKRGGGSVRIRQHKGSVVSVTPALANSIEAETESRLMALADAFNLDLLAIEAGDYSLSNLKIEEVINETP